MSGTEAFIFVTRREADAGLDGQRPTVFLQEAPFRVEINIGKSVGAVKPCIISVNGKP